MRKVLWELVTWIDEIHGHPPVLADTSPAVMDR
jgi:hypothetical protein